MAGTTRLELASSSESRNNLLKAETVSWLQGAAKQSRVSLLLAKRPYGLVSGIGNENRI